MKRAFTTVELLITMGIMISFATVSAVSYHVVRNKFVSEDVVRRSVSLVESARAYCEVRSVPTAVIFSNITTLDGDGVTSERGYASLLVGAGRISRIEGGFLYDEFATEGPFAETKDFGKFEYGLGAAIYDMRNPAGARAIVGAKASGRIGGRKIESVSGTWKVGTLYGIERERIEFPEGYVSSEGAIVFSHNGYDGITSVGEARIYRRDGLGARTELAIVKDDTTEAAR